MSILYHFVVYEFLRYLACAQICSYVHDTLSGISEWEGLVGLYGRAIALPILLLGFISRIPDSAQVQDHCLYRPYFLALPLENSLRGVLIHINILNLTINLIPTGHIKLHLGESKINLLIRCLCLSDSAGSAERANGSIQKSSQGGTCR